MALPKGAFKIVAAFAGYFVLPFSRSDVFFSANSTAERVNGYLRFFLFFNVERQF